MKPHTHDHLSAIELTDRIDEARTHMIALNDQLRRALVIQAIWPDAFNHGACKTGGHMAASQHVQSLADGKDYYQNRAPMAFTEFWIEDGAGNRFYLDRRALRILKQDGYIHPDYNDHSNDEETTND